MARAIFMSDPGIVIYAITRIHPQGVAPRLKSWNLRSGISSPKPTGCCLGDLEADLKIALLSQIGQSTVIF